VLDLFFCRECHNILLSLEFFSSNQPLAFR
jgi:hypothetical protein